MPTLSIVIPAYNEGPTIHRILDKVKAVQLVAGMQKELIIVNDCSKDNTEESILAYKAANTDLPITYYKHEVNMGKGAALHTGIKKATGDYVIIQAIELKEKRFGFEPEVTAKISRVPKVRIYEVGISYYGRTYEEGKKIGWKDGFRAIYCILKYNLFKK